MTSQNYRDILLNFPSQISLGIESVSAVEVPRSVYDRVVVCGMGGSALGTSLANTYFDLRPDIKIHRDYGLPNDVTDKSLVVAISYSGNTEETLSAAEQALADKRHLVMISTGGRLLELAEKNAVPFIKLAAGMPPRLSLGQQFGALATLLAKAGVIADDSEALIQAATEIAQDATIEVKGQEIAQQIGVKIPLIYTSNRLGAIARNWKIKLNETAKVQAYWNTLPEADHNEINSFVDDGSRFHLITIRDFEDHPRVLKRFDLTERYARENGMTVSSGSFIGSTYLAKLLHAVWLGDWVSLALANIKGVDPNATPLIDRLKKDLI